jgi:hypothetical protein
MIICANPRPNRRRSDIINARLRTACIFVGGMVCGQLITMWMAGIL